MTFPIIDNELKFKIITFTIISLILIFLIDKTSYRNYIYSNSKKLRKKTEKLIIKNNWISKLIIFIFKFLINDFKFRQKKIN